MSAYRRTIAGDTGETRKPARCALWILPLALGWSHAVAQPASLEIELKPVIDRLARTASSQQFRQIIGAARASPELARQLGRLVAERKLTEIRIAAAKGSKPFSAWVDGAVMYFPAGFLEEQEVYRGPIFHSGEIQPNNMVYCLGHLAYHLAVGVPDDAKCPGIRAFVQKQLEIEAGAHIQGYNDVMDAALQQNGGKPFDARGALPILMNPWYRDALGKAKLKATGTIDLNAQNIALVAQTLRKLQLADVE